MKATNSPSIVAIGASAGGLEALETFFCHVPTPCSSAFVVIQHLDPIHKGLLPELLQRATPMNVMQAEDGMKVKPNWVYVIPPNKDLSIQHGKLQLLAPVAVRGLRLPIDFFFRALAVDQQERAIGVIFSGMGSDGSLGIRAIKENAGFVFVQTPETAKFDSMPLNAIETGLVDIVASPQELWDRIASCLKHHPACNQTQSEQDLLLKSPSALEQIVFMLRDRNHNDFSLYKKNTIYRRIERRMGLHQIDSIAHYVRYLRENPQEQDLLFKELLIGVTSFFRDAAIWEELKTHAIPALLAEYPAGKELRAWVSACSTGEEAYSLAIIFKEVLCTQSSLHQRFKLKIFATDLDLDAIDKARSGFYPTNIVADVSPERLSRFFVDEGDGYRINKEIREMVIFAQQNIILDPPFTKLDLLSCRNLLIYLSSELQKRLIPLFHYTLSDHGILLLGNTETIGDYSSLFGPVDNPTRLYRRIEHTLSSPFIYFPTKFTPIANLAQKDTETTKVGFSLQNQIDQLILQKYSHPAVVVNNEGDILYFNGRTGKYLEPAAGKANLNVYSMAREGLRYELANALSKAQQQVEAVHVQGLSVGTNGNRQTINLTVEVISDPKELSGMSIIVFTDVDMPPAKPSRKSTNAELKALQIELKQAREELQTMRDERQISQEELRSSNEELQSTNEELQSTNEELTTSKEEMQSLNEELQTVNAELQIKVNDLSWTNNDMKNLLNSMGIASVFLDNSLNIRRFTNHATHLFKLITSDVGRPLSDIVTDMEYPQLHQDAEEVLRTLVFIEKQVQTHDGQHIKVRIMPYRTQENVIDGVVITFIDITEIKLL